MKTDVSRLTEVITVRLTRAEHAALRDQAIREQRKVADWLRILIRKVLKVQR